MVFCPSKGCYILGFSAVVLPLPLKLLGQWVSYLITLSLDILFSLCNGKIKIPTTHDVYLAFSLMLTNGKPLININVVLMLLASIVAH